MDNGRSQTQKATRPKLWEGNLIYEIAKTLNSFLAANTIQTAVAAFQMLTFKDIVFVNMRPDALTDEDKKQFGMNGNNPIRIEGYKASDTNLPDVTDLQHLIKEVNFSQQRVLVMWFPDNVAVPNRIDTDKPLNMSIMALPVSVVKTELARFNP
ncbi:hypothetical protein [Allocoleopsis franciscana]|uniref:Uncharacterized protein n=1 Tax=Allocoleopsis franciscana PCC 7113 TaxID=1173027 RepID=K9WFS8_9CYAN|nr:hypothetical protein [Allocoleopsis franciscana]AFZ18641.1 hypothetical protein Mic7113_2862 [Allocoleopsis franciscana PCC 7113]